MISNPLVFLRHSKLDLPYRDHSLMPFDVFADLGADILNPPIDAVFTRNRIRDIDSLIQSAAANRILVSPSRRCKETGELLSNGIVPTRMLSELTEVRFDLRAMNENKKIEYALQRHDIAEVNNAVFDGMVRGLECEPVEHAYKRVERLFRFLEGVDGRIICVTHDFFMRVIEIYIHRAGAAYVPITFDDLARTRRNAYLSGFMTDRKLDAFTEV